MRVNFTNSLSSTSSMDERSSRMTTATWNQPRVMAGRIMYWIPPRPEVGNHPRCTAKIHISTMPSQNPGRDWPRSAITFAAESQTLSLNTADSTPIGSAMTMLMRRAKPASCSVAGRRCQTSPIAVCPCHFQEWPKSPRTAFERKIAYWVGRGWSSPQCFATRS
jgi:hypothetical protein